jgi:hypothetical protein
MRAPVGWSVAVSVAALLVAVSACASAGDGPSAGSSTSSSPPSATSSPGSGGTGDTASPSLPADLRDRPAVAAAIADAADRAGVAPAAVTVAGWTPVTWSDGSLGCPQEGMGYTQVQVDGQLLVLQVDTALFQYHSRGGGPFAYCANPSKGYTVNS